LAVIQTFHSLCIPLQPTINQTSVDRYQPNQPALDSVDISDSPALRLKRLIISSPKIPYTES